MPPAISEPSTMTSWPRRWALEHSDCHTGTVAVFRPFPRPVTSLPAIKCPNERDVACRVAPTTMMHAPVNRVRRRPR